MVVLTPRRHQMQQLLRLRRLTYLLLLSASSSSSNKENRREKESTHPRTHARTHPDAHLLDEDVVGGLVAEVHNVLGGLLAEGALRGGGGVEVEAQDEGGAHLGQRHGLDRGDVEGHGDLRARVRR